ncbi:hypothetical protein TNCV_970021 [Trichonephila clavipes]|nr:hypothetical protein TNCV_970021 [Trichonephila clavipes]
MIEELHRPLKSAIKCHATERWTEVLPIILLGLRASLKEDILWTPTELVFGTTIRLPGEMFDSSKPDDDVVNFVSKLKSHMQSLHPKPPNTMANVQFLSIQDCWKQHMFFFAETCYVVHFNNPMMALSKSYKGRIVFSLTSVVNGYLYLLIDANLPSFLTLRTCSYLKPRMKHLLLCNLMQQLQHLLLWNLIQPLQRLPSDLHVLVAKFIFQLGIVDTGRGESIPLSTYHVDFIGPLPSTNKSYQHIFTVVDAFTKFTWLYPVKTVSAESALEKLKQQQKTFGNPIRIISDRGSAFTSKLLNDYCDEENMQHLQIATGVPRGNGQVERIHRTLIPVLTKLSLDDSTKWYKYVDRLQRILNSTISRSAKGTPFELLVGTKMRNKEDILIKDLLLEEMAKELLEQREFLRNDAKKNIETLQSKNRKTYNRRRKKASLYKEGDLVAIQSTQFGAGLKLRPKFLGPYKVTKVNSKDRSEVEKVGQHDGPNSTTTSADLMKHFYA